MQKKPFQLLCFFFFLLYAATASAEKDSIHKKIIVGLKETPPFSMKDQQGNWRGINVQLWESIAEELGLNYQYRELTLQGILDGLQDKSLDVGFSALTITAEREKLFDFTHPFYTTGLGIATKKEKTGDFFLLLNDSFLLIFSKLFSRWLC